MKLSKLNRQKAKSADFVQHKIACAIANSEILKNHVIFKGGTMLRVCRYLYYRLSEDMDFSLIDITREEFFEEIAIIAEKLSSENLFLNMMRTSLEGDRHIDWVYGEHSEMLLIEAYPVEDFAVSETCYLSVQNRYDEIFCENSILCASDMAVATSKYNCLGNRYKGRDIYDMAYLASENILESAWSNFVDNWEGFMYPVRPSDVISKIDNGVQNFSDAWENDIYYGYIKNSDKFSEHWNHLNSCLKPIFDTYV